MWYRLLGACLLFLFSITARADDSAIWQYFKVDTSGTSDDLSVGYLITLFGTVGNVLAGGTSQDLYTTFGYMFSAFNIVALGIGVLMITYTVGLGVLNTAESGKFLGEKLSSIWIPVRTAVGTALLVPAVGPGYSMSQVLMMWMVLNGVGAANTIWDFAVDHFTITPKAITAYGPSSAEMDVGYAMLYSLMQAELCARLQSTGRLTSSGTVSAVATPALTTGPYNIKYFIRYSNTSTGLVIPNLCGEFAFSGITANAQFPLTNKTNPDTAQTNANNANGQMRDFTMGYVNFPTTSLLMVPSTGGSNIDIVAAKSILGTYLNMVAARGSIQALLSQKGISLPQGDAGSNPVGYQPYIDAARSWVYNYINQLKTVEARSIPLVEGTNPIPSSASTVNDSLKKGGWITAGFYYFELVRLQNQLSGTSQNGGYTITITSNMLPQNITIPIASQGNWIIAKNTLDALMAPLMQASGGVTQMMKYGPEVIASNSGGLSPGSVEQEMQTFTNTVMNGNHNPGAIDQPQADQTLALLQQSWKSTMQALVNIITNNGASNPSGDPMITLVQEGAALMQTAADAIMWLIVLGPIVGIAAGVLSAFIPPATVLQSLLTTIVPLIYMIFGILYVEGAILGVYLPLIPLLSFIVGGIGWMIAVIEAMVAAPIVAIGLTIPEGQHEILGRAEPAFMMTLNLILRPVLMIIGFVTAIVLLRAALDLLNQGFMQVYLQGAIQTDAYFGFSVIFAGYIMLILAMVQKVFGLPTHLTDRTFDWLGQHIAGYGGAEQMLGEARGAIKERAEVPGRAASEYARGAMSIKGGGGGGGEEGGEGGGEGKTGEAGAEGATPPPV